MVHRAGSTPARRVGESSRRRVNPSYAHCRDGSGLGLLPLSGRTVPVAIEGAPRKQGPAIALPCFGTVSSTGGSPCMHGVAASRGTHRRFWGQQSS
jgi:hypothetical protein